MMFKVGDKIRIISNSTDWSIGSEGVIVEVRPPDREYHYKVYFRTALHSNIKDFHFPLRDKEVEQVVRIGEQLLFPFMSE